ncbi:MAG: DUF1844 domain-containing protein [Candidatus Acidiferrales bacterium]
MADAKHEETFKVIDRRLFGEDGELRKDVVEQERRDEEAAEKKAASQAQQKAKSAAAAPKPAEHLNAPGPQSGLGQPAAEHGIVGPDGSQGLADTDQTSDAAAGGEEHSTSRSFQLLVDFLTRNAAAMLGGMADPRTGQAFVDLEGAREVIDMLDALREKTRGNLSKDDDNLLIEVLGSLKLTFMEISKAAAEQMAKKAKGK